MVCATVTFTDGAIATVMASTGAFPGFPASLSLHGTAGGAVIHGDRLANAIHLSSWKGEEVPLAFDADEYLALLNDRIREEGKFAERA